MEVFNGFKKHVKWASGSFSFLPFLPLFAGLNRLKPASGKNTFCRQKCQPCCPDRRPSPSGGCNKSSAEASRTRAPHITGRTMPGVRRSTAWAMGRTMRRVCYYGTEMWHMMPEGWACVIRNAQFWNNYEFIFIGTRHPNPPTPKIIFSSDFGQPFFANVGKCNFLKRVKKNFWNIPISRGDLTR